MVPGITDTECRINQARYRELHAEAERQRRAASAAVVATSRSGIMETMQRHIGAQMEQAGQLLQSVRAQKATGLAGTPGTLALTK